MRAVRSMMIFMSSLSIVGCAISGPTVNAIDSSLPLDMAIRDAVNKDYYMRNNFIEEQGRARGLKYSPNYKGNGLAMPGSHNKTKERLTKLTRMWCEGNGGQLKVGPIPSLNYYNGKFEQSNSGYLCVKDQKVLGTADKDMSRFLNETDAAYGNQQLELEMARYAEKERREEEKKKLEREAQEKYTRRVRSDPQLGDSVSIHVCNAISVKECIGGHLANGQIQDIRSNKILVRIYDGTTLWVSASELNAPR